MFVGSAASSRPTRRVLQVLLEKLQRTLPGQIGRLLVVLGITSFAAGETVRGIGVNINLVIPAQRLEPGLEFLHVVDGDRTVAFGEVADD